MLINNLGYPRIGAKRELKKAVEKYWAEKISKEELLETGSQIRKQNWLIQKQAGIDLIPSNDFSFYDHVLDMSLITGNVPRRYAILFEKEIPELDVYFAMARGYQKNGLDIHAMEITKWFNTNYHYIVPEFYRNQNFYHFSNKVINEFEESKRVLGRVSKPVLIGPVSYLLLGKTKDKGLDRLDFLQYLLPVYFEILEKLIPKGLEWIQLDEPYLSMDLTDKERSAYRYVYNSFHERFPKVRFLVATYFDALDDNTSLAISLPISALHIDLIEAPEQLQVVLDKMPESLTLSLGIINGRNIWKNNYERTLRLINKAIDKIGADRIMIAPSSSLQHVPLDLDAEVNLNPEIKSWLSFAKQKLNELNELNKIITDGKGELLLGNNNIIQNRSYSSLINNATVKRKTAAITEKDSVRKSAFEIRQEKQKKLYNIPLFPTTTIGSFPQTKEIRMIRSKLKNKEIHAAEYKREIESAIENTIKFQEKIGLDVLVHGEFERNDMVEYFGEMLEGFVFTENGWVQSYGSRCVKPPIIYGDVNRPKDITVEWIKFAQSKTEKPVKGMLTGPITILRWSFVREDQTASETVLQIAIAIKEEVLALEEAGIKIIQIDEPAFREGLPLHKSGWKEYLELAVKAFHIATGSVKDETQIHTHMCYSEFNDIIKSISAMDADVITIETSRSQMELLNAFVNFKYPNEIGPGVYDIHSSRIPNIDEMVLLMERASVLFPIRNLWVNPDCGLKTRKWDEVEKSLENMVQAAAIMRKQFSGIN